ncbi:flagellar hook-length control protein FliK [Serratia sp. NPDC078593]|uniref:flagellar hook-length control protein FliK n=1 Tax=unclassified Serratia (in: enterobacteria) TaxID=2647522 RepID=UPI0037D840BD
MNLTLLPGLTSPHDTPTTLREADLALDETALSSAFNQLFGARLLAPGKDAAKLTLPPLDDAAQPATVSGHHSRDALLAALAEPAEQLPSGERAPLIAPLADGERPTQPTDQDALDKTHEALDVDTLQALFAMLPLTMPSPAQPKAGVLPAEPQPGTEQPTLTTAGHLLSSLNTQTERVAERSTAATARAPEKTLNSATSPALPPSTNTAEPMIQADSIRAQDPGLLTQPTPPQGVAPPVSSPVIAPPPSGSVVNPPPAPLLNASLGSPEWQQALSQQVLMFHRHGQQTAELRLHPQELGALQITLKLDDNQAQLHIASAQGQVRAAVEASMPHLRHALAESGINLGQSSVGSESMPQQTQQHASNGQGQSSYRDQHGGSETPADSVLAPPRLQAMARAVDGVDIFA